MQDTTRASSCIDVHGQRWLSASSGSSWPATTALGPSTPRPSRRSQSEVPRLPRNLGRSPGRAIDRGPGVNRDAPILVMTTEVLRNSLNQAFVRVTDKGSNGQAAARSSNLNQSGPLKSSSKTCGLRFVIQAASPGPASCRRWPKCVQVMFALYRPQPVRVIVTDWTS